MLRRTLISGAFTFFPIVTTASEILETDFLIVGSGGAGLVAAVRGSELGIKHIMVIEKEPLIGGSSIRCGGHWSLSETEFQKSKQVLDSDELFFKDLMEAGQGANDPKLVRKFIEKGREEYNYFRIHGINPLSLWASGGSSVPRGHVYDPEQLIRFLLKSALKNGVKVKTGIRAIDLKISEDKKTLFLTASYVGRLIKIKAKAVLLASGGFANNRDILSTFVDDIDNVQIFSGNGNTGDGLMMAMKLGAQLIDTEFIKPSYGFIRNASDANDFSMIFYGGAVILNQSGKRFVNESMSYKDIGPIALKQTNGKSYIVFDERIRKDQLERRPPEAHLIGKITNDNKNFFVSHNLEEAARAAGVNAENAVTTIREYNRAIDSNDLIPFQRQTLSGGFGKPVKIESPPFYVMPATCGIMGTYCGLKVNEDTQVLLQNGETIENLLAAGEIMGGVHGANFTPGCGFGKALAFGRVAAETARTLIKW